MEELEKKGNLYTIKNRIFFVSSFCSNICFRTYSEIFINKKISYIR